MRCLTCKCQARLKIFNKQKRSSLLVRNVYDVLSDLAGPNVIKLFVCNKPERLSFAGQPFLSCLIFAGKVGAYHSEAPFKRSTLG
jgi:hypothetical protein